MVSIGVRSFMETTVGTVANAWLEFDYCYSFNAAVRTSIARGNTGSLDAKEVTSNAWGVFFKANIVPQKNSKLRFCQATRVEK